MMGLNPGESTEEFKERVKEQLRKKGLLGINKQDSKQEQPKAKLSSSKKKNATQHSEEKGVWEIAFLPTYKKPGSHSQETHTNEMVEDVSEKMIPCLLSEIEDLYTQIVHELPEEANKSAKREILVVCIAYFLEIFDMFFNAVLIEHIKFDGGELWREPLNKKQQDLLIKYTVEGILARIEQEKYGIDESLELNDILNLSVQYEKEGSTDKFFTERLMNILSSIMDKQDEYEFFMEGIISPELLFGPANELAKMFYKGDPADWRESSPGLK